MPLSAQVAEIRETMDGEVSAWTRFALLPSLLTLQVSTPGGSVRPRSCRPLLLQWTRVRALVVRARLAGAALTGDEMLPLVDRIAAAIARAEALPHDALRKAHPRKRTLEDLRLERPELIVGCWASG